MDITWPLLFIVVKAARKRESVAELVLRDMLADVGMTSDQIDAIVFDVLGNQKSFRHASNFLAGWMRLRAGNRFSVLTYDSYVKK